MGNCLVIFPDESDVPGWDYKLPTDKFGKVLDCAYLLEPRAGRRSTADGWAPLARNGNKLLAVAYPPAVTSFNVIHISYIYILYIVN